ncbi:MAG: acyl carrier protein [Christensenellales bacterium]|jgi:acyl carrier protein
MFEKIAEIIADQLGIDSGDVTLESNLTEDLKADSIDIVALIMDLESEYGIEISDDELLKLKTVGDVVTFIEARG